MIRYGKLKNGGLVLAPDKIAVNGKRYAGKIPEHIYLEAGYYPIHTGTITPEGYKEDGLEIKDGAIVKKYRELTEEEKADLEGMRIVPMSKEEAEEYDHMEETLATARTDVANAQAEAETARQEAAVAVEAKEAAEAALADTADIISKIEEVFD